jgi:cellulose synthase/poly-beta-1,6-N-acetylglucosamine synthase-like glycosyltransferase
MTGIQVLSNVINLAYPHVGKVLLVGLASAAFYNWRLWQRDKEFLAKKGQPEPLPPLETWMQLPSVSVLVAAWNEADHIERHMQSFLRLRYPHKELVLCAGGIDGTYEIAARHACEDIIVLEQHPGEGKQRALRRGLDQTTGEIIFLTDADCILENEPFERTLLPVSHGVEQAATGSSQPFYEQLSDPFVITQAASQAYSALRGPEYAPGILGRNCAVVRALLLATGALDTPAPTGTDYVLAKELSRAGIRIRQVPHSRIPTEYPIKVQVYMRQQRRWLRNVFHYGWKFGAIDELRLSLQTSLIGLSMLLLPFLGFVFTPWLIVLWVMLSSHALLARLRYIGFAGKILDHKIRYPDVLWQGPLLFLDFIAWAQPLNDYFRHNKLWKW